MQGRPGDRRRDRQPYHGRPDGPVGHGRARNVRLPAAPRSASSGSTLTRPRREPVPPLEGGRTWRRPGHRLPAGGGAARRVREPRRHRQRATGCRPRQLRREHGLGTAARRRRLRGPIIIGADTGWFDPGFPQASRSLGGRPWHPAGTARDYRSIPAEFVPHARAGFSERLIRTLMHSNPWSALSR